MLADDVVRLREIALATTILQGLSLLQQQGCEDQRDRACDNDVARLGEITLANDVVSLREIALSTTMSQGLYLSQQRGHEDRGDRACNNNVARLGEIVLAMMMLRG